MSSTMNTLIRELEAINKKITSIFSICMLDTNLLAFETNIYQHSMFLLAENDDHIERKLKPTPAFPNSTDNSRQLAYQNDLRTSDLNQDDIKNPGKQLEKFTLKNLLNTTIMLLGVVFACLLI